MTQTYLVCVGRTVFQSTGYSPLLRETRARTQIEIEAGNNEAMTLDSLFPVTCSASFLIHPDTHVYRCHR